MPIKTTEPRRLCNGELLVVKYGFDEEFAKRYKQAPHFSMTTETYSTYKQPGEKAILFEGKHYWPYSFGAGHDDIHEGFPELEPMIKYHLVSTEAPMHYYANAKYWLEMHYGVSKWAPPTNTNPLDRFKSTVLFDESIDKVPGLSEVYSWCESRLNRIMQQFRNDCEKAGVAWPKME